MLHNALLPVLFVAPCFAQSLYDFNNLNGSDVYPYTLLDGQDNWSEQTYNSAKRCGVTATLGKDGTKCLRYQESGPSYGCDASRINDANWSYPSFSSSVRNAYFQADLQLGFWGGSFGLAYDTNNNGVIRGNEPNERGVRFNVGTQTNVQFQLIGANNIGVTVPLANLGTVAGGHWLRIRVIMDLAAAGTGGLGYVEVQNLTLGATSFTAVPGLQGVPLGLNPVAINATNPLLWNALWLHFEGATYGLDNVEIGRVGYARPYGTGCNGVAGPVDLTVQGAIANNATIQFVSGNHGAGRAGVLIIGISNTSYGSLNLPYLLDPLLGTSGCSLYASVEVTLAGTTSATVPATLMTPITLPAAAYGARVFTQHACFEAVPGGLSFSNGLILQLL